MRISAGELRRMGAEGVPAGVPDCAEADVVFTPGDAQIFGGGMLNIPIAITFLTPFEWVEATVRVEP